MKVKLDSFFSSHFTSTLFSHKEIFQMLFPLILDMIFINAISMFTTSMISSSGQASVAAVSMITPIVTLIACLLNAIAAGGTVVVAQYKGRGDKNKIKEAAGHTFLITLAIAILICALLILFATPAVHLLYGNAEQEVLDKSITYLKGSCFSIIILSAYISIFAIFRGLGENKICLRLTIVINFSYFLFCFVLLNILHLDIMGTIIALLSARALGSALSLYYLFVKKNRILLLQFKDIFCFDGRLFHSMLKISIPFGAEQFFFYGGGIIVQKYMVELGTAAVAANAIANSLFSLVFAAPFAVGNLATTVIGQCIGNNQRDLAKWYGKKLVHLGTATVLLSILVFVPLLPLLLGMYHPEAHIVPLVLQLLLIGILPMPLFYSMSNVMPYVLRSAGDAVYSSIVSLITMWLIRVGAGYVLAIPLGYGISGIWFCMSFEWVIRFVLFLARYKGNTWLSKNTI